MSAPILRAQILTPTLGMHTTTSLHNAHSKQTQIDFRGWIEATSDPSELVLGIEGFSYGDLYDNQKLQELTGLFFDCMKEADPKTSEAFEAYKNSGGAGMTPQAVSDVLLAASAHLSRFVAKLFKVEAEAKALAEDVEGRNPLWKFKKEFSKKKLFKPSAGKAWTSGAVEAAHAARRALIAMGAPADVLESGSEAEEIEIAKAGIQVVELDDIARKAAKAGGASWTDELHERAAKIRAHISADPVLATAAANAIAVAGDKPTDAEDSAIAAFAVDALEAWLNARRSNSHDPVSRWATMKAPMPFDHQNLVQLRRPESTLPELFVGPEEHRRDRQGFELSDRRMNEREVESEIDYCIFCHEQDKDSCAKGLRDNKTKQIKANPLGVELNGCPLDERISEMHMMRQLGDSLAALALVCIDNPLLPGTGHRICNDCMKACVFQKQEPVNIPQIETAVLTDVLEMPWGLEIYCLLARWNPLNIKRPEARAYNGKNVLIVGLGPAGYTLAHHLTCEGFACVAVDGLKIEPLPVELTGDESRLPRPVKNFDKMYLELDERLLLGFGGVSEYGITIRWDKNFLTILYLMLARQRLLKMYGGVRFGGTLDVEDAWKLGFDHVAVAAGAGRPTIISMKNNISRGIRKASDFLMALQLTGAYKHSALANLQVRLPAVVIGGGLTAIDTATELLAYYIVQVEKLAERMKTLIAERGEAQVMAMFDEEEREILAEQLGHAAQVKQEREQAAKEGRAARFQHLLDSWGGVSLVYRKRLQDSPAYRLNHEEVIKSLEEGVRYIENLAPVEAVLDHRGAVKGMVFERQKAEGNTWKNSGEMIELPARMVCVAAGTSPNITYEKEHPGTFGFDKRKNFFQAHKAYVNEEGKLIVEPSEAKVGFFTSYNDGQHAVSYYGDNHPYYAGSVVKAMASAKDAYPHVVALFKHELDKLNPADQAARDASRKALFAKLDEEFIVRVHAVNRLTPTIVEVIVKAPSAARKFEPGQFYRLQNYEVNSHIVDGTRLAMEGIALTGAWVDKEQGLLSMIALEMGASSRLLASLRVGEEVVVMGPTGTPTEIPSGEVVLLAGGGLGNAVLFSIAKALRAKGDKVVYFAGYKKGEDLFKQDDIEVATDQIIWCTDTGVEIAPRRPMDRHFRGNIVQAMKAYADGTLDGALFKLSEVSRIIAIGSDRMMNAVREARHGVLAPYLNPNHVGIASINSPMQCMMKEVCAQCLQKHIDPQTGKETIIFTCFNQDQLIDHVDFKNLNARLRNNSLQEKVANAWLDRLLTKAPNIRLV